MMYQNLEVSPEEGEETHMLEDTFFDAQDKFKALRAYYDPVKDLYEIKASFGKSKRVSGRDAIAILRHIIKHGLNKLENNYK